MSSSSDEKTAAREITERSKWGWTQKLPWFIPHEKIVIETQEEIDAGYAIRKKNEEEKQSYHVKEYRDEAHRPWYAFFNEVEYRLTKEEQSKHDWWRWYDKGTSKAEKKLILKQDLLITVTAFLGFWTFSLNQANLNNAYVSGMKEEIGMKGNDLIDTQVLFSAASIIFQLPLIYILPRVNPTYMLFGAEFLWSIFTLATSSVHNVATLKAFRFIVGAGEAAFFPIIHSNFALNYTHGEIHRRAGFYYFGLYLGTLTSGLLQSGIHNALDGINGISGWRWMFIIDGIISFGVTFVTLLSIPGSPFKCYSIWLTDDEIKLARKRMRINGTDEHTPTTKEFLDPKVWKKIFTSWHFWIFTIANIGGWNGNSASSGSFVLWLKSLDKYSIEKMNNLTAIPPALGILYIFIVCFGADFIRQRFLMISFSQLMNMIGNIVLALWDVPEGAKWFGFCLGYWNWSQSSVFYPLMNDILRRDANQKSIEWLISYIFCAQSNVWLNKILYPTVEAPKFIKGFTAAACFSALQGLFMAIALGFYKRDERAYAYEHGIVLYNSAKGEDPETALKNITQEVKDSDVSSIAISTSSLTEDVVTHHHEPKK